MHRKVVNAFLLSAICVILMACGPSPSQRNAQVTAIAASIYATQTAAASTATPAPPTAAPALPTATPAPVEEKYEQVDSSELAIDFQANMGGRVAWDKDGNVTEFGGGKVTRFTVGGKPIEMVSDDMALVGKEVFIDTKDYGRIKVTFGYGFGVTLWLKPSQKAKLLELASASASAPPPATATAVRPTAILARATVTPIRPTPAPESTVASLPVVTIVSHEGATPSRLELWLEFQLRPGDTVPGSQIESDLNNGSVELVLPNGEKKTFKRVPHSPTDSEVTSNIWLPTDLRLRRSPPPAGALPLNGMSFGNSGDSPRGPRIRIPLEKLSDVSAKGQYRISWQSGGRRTNPVTFEWDGSRITTVRESSTGELTASTRTPMPPVARPAAVQTLSPAPLSAEVRASADRAFASGLVVYMYDLQPSSESRSSMGAHDFTLRYILSKDAKAVPNSLLIWKVDAEGTRKMTMPFGMGNLEDWTSDTGRLIFAPIPDNDMRITNAEGKVVTDVESSAYLDVVLVEPDMVGQTKSVSEASRKLSNTVRIPVASEPSSVPAAKSAAPQDDAGEMLLIPAGTFRKGCDPAHAYASVCRSDLPLYTVYLDAYRIDKTEVTNAQYARCVAAGGCTGPATYSSSSRPSYYDNPSYANHPVILVTWHQANAYCAWAGKRLPTVAEWDKAARGPSDTRPFPWGDADPSCTVANFRGCVGDTSAVGSYPAGASPYGALDLVGNVGEWVSDWYRSDYDQRPFTRNPLGAVSGIAKMTLGGGWSTYPGSLLSGETARSSPFISSGENNPASRYDSVGFRCAASPGGETGQPNPGRGGITPAKAPAVTAVPTIQTAPPKAGTANAAGRVLWNNEPVSGTEVNLCSQYSSFEGCGGNRYAAKTDPQGFYVFENVSPSPYYLLVHAIDVDGWFFKRPANPFSFNAPITHTLTAGETRRFVDMQIWKHDLEGASAKPGEKPDQGTATLSWKAYPGAAYYGVYIGEQRLNEPIGERVNGNSITVTNPPLDKWWLVEAFNADDIKIAQSRYLDFKGLRSPGASGDAPKPISPVATIPPVRPTAPVRPKVGQSNATALPTNQQVPFQIMACPTQGVTLSAIAASRPGWWNISGSAEIPNLDYWKAEISADGKGWSMLYRSTKPVRDGVLVEFNTGTVPRGTYQIRLLVVDRTGNYPEPCIIQVSTK